MSPNSKLRFDAFDQPVSLADVRRELPGEERKYKRQIAGTALIVAIIAVSAAIPFLADAADGDDVLQVVAWVVALGVVSGSLIPVTTGQRQRAAVKAKRFAADNGLAFTHNEKEPMLNGLIFNRGRERTLELGFTAKVGDGRELQLGTYHYVTGSGRSRQTVTWGFIRMDLSRRLPHMVLDGRTNNFISSNLPATFDRSQRLALEGDFNDYFDLYVPAGYERDALYALTPDIMALLLDNARAYDLEIVDNQVLVYVAGGFEWSSRETIEKLVTLAEKVGAELEEQTDYYADERVGDRQANTIAEPGRTLKAGTSWVTVVAVGIGAFIFFGDELELPTMIHQLIIIVILIFILGMTIRHLLRNNKLRKKRIERE